MHDPMVEWGINGGNVVDGFFGSLVRLSVMQKLGTVSLLVSLFVGTACAAYLTKVVMWFAHLPETLEKGTAFLWGMTAMSIIQVILKILEQLIDNPLSIIEKITGIKK